MIQAAEPVGFGPFHPGMKQEFLERLAGGEPVNTVCKDDQMPSASTVYRAVQFDTPAGFRNEFLLAQFCYVAALSDQCLDIADADGDEAVSKRQLRIQTRLQLVDRLSKQWGASILPEGLAAGPIERIGRYLDSLTSDEITKVRELGPERGGTELLRLVSGAPDGRVDI